MTGYGRAMETSPGKYTTVLRELVGVAGIIAPWNSPVVLFVRSLAPALAAGCTVVGKLPGFTAQVNARMCELFASVESLPTGVINVFTEHHGAGARAIRAASRLRGGSARHPPSPRRESGPAGPSGSGGEILVLLALGLGMKLGHGPIRP